MPELSRFYGIIIRMFSEPSERHHVPHFHAYYGEHVAVFSISPWPSSLALFRSASSDSSRLGRSFTRRSCFPTGNFLSRAESLPQSRLCSSVVP